MKISSIFGTKTTPSVNSSEDSKQKNQTWTWTKWGNNVDIPERLTKEQVQEMIDKAIDNHNKTATMISASIGGVLLFFYAHGVLAVIDRVSH